jgi:site-specific DNA recombinase
MAKCAIYCRVSTQQQVGIGLSLEAQQLKCEQMAAVRDLEVAEVLTDAGESAKNIDRPAMRRLMAMIQSRAVDAVIIAKLDRLTRSVRDLADLLEIFNKGGVALISVGESLDTKSASGELVMNIMTAVSQWERRAIGERTKAVLQFKRSNGEKTGGRVPYGYDVVDRCGKKALIPNEGEQEVLRVMREMKAAGQSYQQIADALNASGVQTKEGKAWFRQYIHRILKANVKEAVCLTA